MRHKIAQFFLIFLEEHILKPPLAKGWLHYHVPMCRVLQIYISEKKS